ncbi:MAG TPA: hypothetical protein VG321_09755, partial [Solirubrobacteraceae bacterium]|nr:hypothetical protein [Solirubrobacteraceae bacterium]
LVRTGNPMLAGALEACRPVAVGERELTLAFPSGASFLKRKAEQDDYRRAAAEALRNVTGQALLLRYELAAADASVEAPVAVADPPLRDEELIARFVAELDAQEIHDTDDGNEV